MKIGLGLSTQPALDEAPKHLIDRLVAQVRQADRWGFETCVFTEHHQDERGYLPSPLVIVAALSTVTSRIKLGPAVLLAPLYDPIRLAEDIAVIDQFTKGRVIVGLGAGYSEDDFAAFDVARAQRGRLLDESVDMLRLAWAGSRFSFEGSRGNYDNVLVSPQPFQEAGPPLWIGGLSDAALRRAATKGDAWISTMVAPGRELARLAKRYREHATATRVARPKVILQRECWIASSRSEAFKTYAEGAMSTHRLYFELGRYDTDPTLRSVASAEDLTLEAVAEDRFLLGSVAEVIDELDRYRQTVDPAQVILRLGHPDGPNHEAVMDAIEIVGREVIPAVAEWRASGRS